MQITDGKIEEYLLSLIPARDPDLATVENEAWANQIPMVGPVEGNFLYMLTRAVGAKNVLEVGTATGYSAVWLGRAVKQAGGQMTAIEMDPKRAEAARRNLASCGLQDTVTLINQDAFEFLAKDRSSYDVVFLDILRGLDPEGINRLLELVLPRLKVGGLLLGDNALHGGDALDPKNPSAAGLAEFNRRIFSHPNLVSSLVPLRDGVAISLKVG